MRRLMLLALVSGLAVACSAPPPPGEIRFALAQAPLTLDPRYAVDAASERINRLIYRPLVDFDAQSRPVPALAAWIQRDALHYRFTLRADGRTFHDGSPLTAEDVAATYRSLIALAGAPHAAEFAHIASVTVQDSVTLDFTLRQPDPQFPARLVIGILPAHLIAREHDFSRHPVGSGPLRFRSWNRLLRLERCRDRQPIVLEEVRDPTVRVLKLVRGEADLLQGDMPPELVTYLRQRPEVVVHQGVGSNFSYLGFNLNDPVLQDVRVRRAVALAIDRGSILRHTLVEGSRLATALLPPEHWAGNAALPTLPYAPAQARALLAEAGVKLPLKLTLKTSTDTQRVRLATMMQAQMRPAGIALEIRSLDWGTFFGDVRRGTFQMYGLTWTGIRTPEIYRLAFHSQSVPPAGANRGRLQDAALDALIEQQDWVGVTARVHALLPYVPLWHEGQFVALRHGITGYLPAPDGNWDALETIAKGKGT